MFKNLEKQKFRKCKQEYMNRERAIWVCVKHHSESDEIVKVTTKGLAMKWQEEDWENRSLFNVNYIKILAENKKGVFYKT